ncbi:MAG: DUF429 domain-containing protein [Acidimicrobiaceae bacterium]|nr:DUF429 domain-containing protein [Acidimicrobiaceae bacterium]
MTVVEPEVFRAERRSRYSRQMALSMRERDRGSGVVGGVDAGRRGKAPAWILAVSEAQPGASAEFRSYPTFGQLWDYAKTKGLLVVAVDMPLGLPMASCRWRPCEERARGRLGKKRERAVFPSPPLCTLDAVEHAEADRLAVEAGGNTLSGDTYRLLEKCRDVREALDTAAFRSSARPRVAEVHAEVCFWEMNGKKPTHYTKRSERGQADRLSLLSSHFSGIDAAVEESADAPPDGALRRYDMFDAAAAAWTARRIASGDAERLGNDERDEGGFPMSIWI